MNKQQPGFTRYMPALDGVRGVAILLVMMIHFFPSAYEGSIFLVIAGKFVQTGWLGVDLFFVLSGFLITGILLDTIGEPNYFRNFYARRTLRIFPLYYGVIFVLLALTVPLHFDWKGKAVYFLLYVENFLHWDGARVLHIAPYLEIGHFWTLAVEEQFYLIWPALILLCRTPRSAAALSVAVIVAVFVARGLALDMGVEPSTVYHTTFFRIDTLAFGALLAALVRFVPFEAITRISRIGVYVGLGGTIALLCSLNGSWKDLQWFSFVGYTFFGVFFTCLIAMSLVQGSFASRAFLLPPLRFLGKYSYGLYVWHLLFFPYFSLRLHPYLNGVLGSKVLGGILTGLLASALAIILALLSYHLYELPFLKLKRYFESRRPNPAHGSHSPAPDTKPLPG